MVKRILVKRAKKEFVKELDREFTVSKQKIYSVDDISRDFHTEYGSISKKDLQKKDGSKLKSSTKKEFIIFSPSFIDKYFRINRSAQIIPLKDIGFIVTETGIGKESLVVDAGAGSGALACFLAHLVKQVVTYEIRDDFYDIVRQNKQMLELDNLIVKHQDVYKKIDEKNVDLCTLDLPEPWKAIPSVRKALKVGGFLVVYNPSVSQIADFVNSINKDERFLYLKTIEVFERHWEVDGRKVRPKSQPIGHSGFLVFVRKVR
ncbi:MAG: rRNA adenine N-6-methyltransferase family protein [Candidatus Woesearchaeota archaeon]